MSFSRESWYGSFVAKFDYRHATRHSLLYDPLHLMVFVVHREMLSSCSSGRARHASTSSRRRLGREKPTAWCW